MYMYMYTYMTCTCIVHESCIQHSIDHYAIRMLLHLYGIVQYLVERTNLANRIFFSSFVISNTPGGSIRSLIQSPEEQTHIPIDQYM